ncbi:ABC transporter ATP-binding protein [Agromyces silvae]|uniref:ABC transporter ATP-binding protein n=1 Tax=Agromyces silvae TaxID=3388266 RepID=UPI00280B539C|nr:ABC transporter ATP-binding protein [Agromyces protaetiae]
MTNDAMTPKAPLLEVRGLSVEFLIGDDHARAVDDVSFRVYEDEVLGVVGESGSGKSVAMAALTQLLPSNASIPTGEIVYRGRDLLDLSAKQLRSEIRGSEIATIFQDPMTSLNPVMTVGAQIVEALRLHGRYSRRAARERAVELLELVGIRDAQDAFRRYPHEYSGGMRQRVMISIAVASDPSLIIADEPTTALDVTIQRQVIDVLVQLRAQRHTSVIFISHDLDLVADIADRIVIMYAGQIVESGSVRDIFDNPLHPYTKLLLRSVPQSTKDRGELPTIAGSVPAILDIPRGTCRIAPRVPWLPDDAHEEAPELREVEPGHAVRCVCYRSFTYPDPSEMSEEAA